MNKSKQSQSGPFIAAMFVGLPKEIHDSEGIWVSSIFRQRVNSAVAVSQDGLAGDRVTQPYHGGRGASVCAHLMNHYRFWNERFHLSLAAGNVGENLTVDGIQEDDVHVGDIVRLGTALLQVSGPRVPCANQARRIGRPDWVKLTIRENRTGFYLRVLEPGTTQPGDDWCLQERLNADGSIPSINRCMYLDFEAGYARRITLMSGLEPWWKEQMSEKLASSSQHWTATMSD